MGSTNSRLVLASGSAARARVLASAGVAFEIMPAGIDETVLKAMVRAEQGSAAACARALAEAKAQAVSRREPRVLVIGADQILVCDGEWFDKPEDLCAARAQLKRLRGRTHALVTAICAVRDGERVWQFEAAPMLTMRCFSEAFLDTYLAAEGDAVLGSVGAYRLEGTGVQLFDRIDGDYFTILGLPLVELLSFLRASGAVFD